VLFFITFSFAEGGDNGSSLQKAKGFWKPDSRLQNLVATSESKTKNKPSKIKTASFSGAIQRSKEKEKEKRKPFSLQNVRNSKKEGKAKGWVLRFHKWPNVKQRNKIASILNSKGLKKTKDIKFFKAQLWQWQEGRIKTSKKADQVCEKLRGLSFIKRCSPDVLLHPNSLDQETEAHFNSNCETCKSQDAELIAVAKQNLNIRTCGVVSDKHSLMKGELSDHWAQELIGSDLLKEELKKVPPPNKEDWIAVFDSEREEHAFGVKNVLSDDGKQAVLPELIKNQQTVIHNVNSVAKFNEPGYGQPLSLYEMSYTGDYLSFDKKRSPYYINNSMSWEESQDIYDAFQQFSVAKTTKPIVVISAGNNFPSMVDDVKTQASKYLDVIIVGSLSPYGLVSDFSESGEEVAILAPSDYWLTSAGENGEYRKFGGTSGAASLVTGSLAGFEWLSGYHPTPKEAKMLLQKTALPTLHSHEQPPINGVGMLNAYKLGMVAKKLKQKCQKAMVIQDCFKKEILKEENYHFPKDEGLESKLKQTFPACVSPSNNGGLNTPTLSTTSSCEEKKKAFTRLRKAILLNPDTTLLDHLACIYESAGFIENASGLGGLMLALLPKEKRDYIIKATIKRDGKYISEDNFRVIVGIGGFEEDLVLSPSLIRKARGIGDRGLAILKRSMESGDIELQQASLESAKWIGEKALPLLEIAFESNNIELQKKALFEAYWVRDKALPLLERGLRNNNLQLQQVALESARRMRKNALPLLNKILNASDLNLNKNIREEIEYIISEYRLIKN